MTDEILYCKISSDLSEKDIEFLCKRFNILPNKFYRFDIAPKIYDPYTFELKPRNYTIVSENNKTFLVVNKYLKYFITKQENRNKIISEIFQLSPSL